VVVLGLKVVLGALVELGAWDEVLDIRTGVCLVLAVVVGALVVGLEGLGDVGWVGLGLTEAVEGTRDEDFSFDVADEDFGVVVFAGSVVSFDDGEAVDIRTGDVLGLAVVLGGDIVDFPAVDGPFDNGASVVPGAFVVFPPVASAFVVPASVPGASVAGLSVPGASVAGLSVPGASVAGLSVPGASVAGASVPGAAVAGPPVTGAAVVDAVTVLVVGLYTPSLQFGASVIVTAN